MSGIASKVIEGVFKVAKIVYERSQAANANTECSQQILTNVKDLQKFADQLKKIDQEGYISDSVKEELEKVNDDLQLIEVQCNRVTGKKKIKGMIDASSDKTDLEKLSSLIQRARDGLNLAISIANLSQTTQIRQDIKHGNKDIKNTVQHPEAGLYLKPQGSRPNRINKFTISDVPEGDLMELLWTSAENRGISVDRYELTFDDGSSRIVPLPFDQITSRSDICTIRLGDPQIIPGETYTLKIRAVNGSGPGVWSSSVTFVFHSGPPAKPKKPKLTVQSPTRVIVEVKTLSEKEEHGSAVTQCQVQYMRIEQSNEIERYWTSLNFTLTKKDVDVHKLAISSLQPHTKYRFQVKMINSCGKGEPSESCEVTTDCVTPGPPSEVRISSKRLPEILKIRWKPPSQNPEGVVKYKIQYRLVNDSRWITSATRENSAKSHKVTDLKTDTKYQFQVLVLNQNDDGNASLTVLGETRYGTAGQIAASIAAGVGGTIGGPLVAGTGFGLLAAQAAKSVPDSETGKTAASVAAGIGAGIAGGVLGFIVAPFVGISAGILANQKVKGNMDDISPQTSDDEESNQSLFQTIAKQSKETVSSMLPDN